ncbi:MAG: protein arginine N-methyltransferase 1 [Parcubacteria group bacterium Licking1014_1]|nr:MAG: protein arginine N-methyltransferase 1 [Parcubacteria group bacterium Licking1014_1]
MKLGNKVDIIVSETIGFTGLEENIVDIMSDAKKRFGHKNTILIPSQISVRCAPTCDTTANKLTGFWQKPINGFNYKKIAQLAKNNLYGRLLISHKKLLSNPAVLFSYKLGTDRLLKKDTKVTFKINNESSVTGFVIWFSAVLSDSQKLNSYKPRNHWQQVLIPFDNTIKIKAGEVVSLQFTVSKVKKYISYAWTYEVYNNSNKLIHGGKGDTANIIKFCTK